MKVLVVGDVIIDKFHYGTALGISAETPTIVAKRQEETFTLGGAANVCRHLEELCATYAYLLTAADGNENIQAGLYTEVVEIPGYSVTTKERFFVDGYKLLQFDQLNEGKHDNDSELQFCDAFDALLPDIDRVVIADNRHGVMSRRIAAHLIKKCNQVGKPIIVDSQVSQSTTNHGWYRDCSIMLVNERELDAIQFATSDCAYKFCEGNNEHFDKVLLNLSKKWNCDIVVKLGEKGSYSLIDGMFHRHHGHEVEIVDTCGAGDAFLAVLASGELSSEDVSDNLRRANLWAALSCEMKGTETPNGETLS